MQQVAVHKSQQEQQVAVHKGQQVQQVAVHKCQQVQQIAVYKSQQVQHIAVHECQQVQKVVVHICISLYLLKHFRLLTIPKGEHINVAYMLFLIIFLIPWLSRTQRNRPESEVYSVHCTVSSLTFTFRLPGSWRCS